MKLIIQIPAYNEENTLTETIEALPKKLPGIDVVEYLVVDDGSVDKTAEIAKSLGVHHVLRLGSNRGLGQAFSKGIQYALSKNADIVVNTDADNQYCADDIIKLIEPIINNIADLVIGCRPIMNHPEFGVIKKMLQLAGSWTLRHISQTTARDAASGFRAFSKETCQRLIVYSRFSYCMETLIQAGNMGLRVASVDIRVNPTTRPSRLFRSIPEYIYKSASTMVVMFILYRPGRFFFILGSGFLCVSLALGIRYFYLIYWAARVPGRTYIPSLILLSLCALTSVLLFSLGVISEVMKSLRRLSEENLYLKRKDASDYDKLA